MADSMTTPVRADARSALRQLSGVLFFPVTPFDESDRIAEEPLADHVAAGVAAGTGGVFIACGTGEFHALNLSEYERTVRVGVTATERRVPVIAGVGGPLGQARVCIDAAQAAGVDGLLVMPPYLVEGPQEGVARYIEAIAAHTGLPLIAYHRGIARFTLATVERLLALPTLAGIKDGVGDVALAQQFVHLARAMGRDDVRFFNGLLTAEASQAAYTAIGVPLYSSAVFAMAPGVALAFHRAHVANDADRQRELLDRFFTPLVRLRDTTPGFGVALIKAGVRLGGIPAGPVRPPLVDPDPVQSRILQDLLQVGQELVA